MKKVINQEAAIVDEMIEGFIAAYSNDYKKVPDVKGITYKHSSPDKVGIVIGGGTGHEPLFIGAAGEGLADGVALGNVFAAPTPDTILEVTKSVDQGKGVLYIYGNYAGDVLNFDVASELAEVEDIDTETVQVTDDVVSAEEKEERRGIAGDMFVLKIAGGAAASGLPLSEVKRLTAKANDNLFSIGVGLSPGTSPGKTEPMFELPEDEIEYGLGIHGEKGIRRSKMKPADELTTELLEELQKVAGLQSDEEVAVLINGLGKTTLMELFIVNRKVQQWCEERNINVYDTDVNSYCTTQDMGGFSITFMKLDDELKKYFDVPAASPYYTRANRGESE
ncbi:dihydroxyacetone kinase subunit DhaK [Alteribacillus sp. YIM 98480]|uniref:dihydroxyacetone kinase subunit DhaK n=1 Tax=Alteribacillus sp. YIM 98480 TaxID=2606599 RepID=UPI0018EF2B64|nr:dihydroxyacetone kinase subunit DhaK [Alteribacillus sp. YIM 98480]